MTCMDRPEPPRALICASTRETAQEQPSEEIERVRRPSLPASGPAWLSASSVITPGCYDVREASQFYSAGYQYNSDDGPLGTIGSVPRINAQVSLLSKRGGRKIKLAVGIASRVLRGRILHFELKLQLTLRRFQWMPWLGCSMTIINEIPDNSPIFFACRHLRFQEVRSLVESGAASPNDRKSDGMGLLEVSHQSPRCCDSEFVGA